MYFFIYNFPRYVKELFRVYLPGKQPTKEEINSFVTKLKGGSTTFQEVEDDVKMLALVSVKPPTSIFPCSLFLSPPAPSSSLSPFSLLTFLSFPVNILKKCKIWDEFF